MIQSFTIPFPSGGKFISSTSFPNQYMGENQISNRYVLSENPLCLTAIRFDFERFEVEFYENKQSSVCRIGYRQWIESETYADEMTACGQHYYAMHTPVSLAGAWENTVFHMRCVYVTMPIIDDLYISFENEGENIVIEYKKSERSFGNCDTRIYGEKQNN